MNKIISNHTVENFKVKDESIVFYDVKKAPFELFGFYDVYSGEGYRRIPDDVAKNSTTCIAEHTVLYRYKMTAGGRIRFKTNSDRLAIRVKLPALFPNPHMTPVMNYGFDYYITKDGEEVFGGLLNPPVDVIDEYDGLVNLGDNSEKEITINFPLYNEVESVMIGLREGAAIEKHTPYKIDKPVLFYGSSITQGACASRPGLCYENLLSRQFDMDYINLGFAGACRAEDAMIEHLKTLDISAFVLDYDHNTPDPDHLKNTHFKVYNEMRKANPDIPIILVTKPDFSFEKFDESERRAIIMDTYSKGIAAGDKKLYFVDGAAFFIGLNRLDCTLDGCHPNDLGFYHMAKAIGETLKIALNI